LGDIVNVRHVMSELREGGGGREGGREERRNGHRKRGGFAGVHCLCDRALTEN